MCNIRKTIRVCLDCLLDPVTGAIAVSNGNASQQSAAMQVPTAYCFLCFTNAHADEPEKALHRYQDTVIESRPENDAYEADDNTMNKQQMSNVVKSMGRYLYCTSCSEPATRKCLGILDDRKIDELCSELQRAPSKNWLAVLQRANVGGEKKLIMMLDQLKGMDKADFLTATQLQQVNYVDEIFTISLSIYISIYI
jgi:hypothetical protein